MSTYNLSSNFLFSLFLSLSLFLHRSFCSLISNVSPVFYRLYSTRTNISFHLPNKLQRDIINARYEETCSNECANVNEWRGKIVNEFLCFFFFKQKGNIALKNIVIKFQRWISIFVRNKEYWNSNYSKIVVLRLFFFFLEKENIFSSRKKRIGNDYFSFLHCMRLNSWSFVDIEIWWSYFLIFFFFLFLFVLILRIERH